MVGLPMMRPILYLMAALLCLLLATTHVSPVWTIPIFVVLVLAAPFAISRAAIRSAGKAWQEGKRRA